MELFGFFYKLRDNIRFRRAVAMADNAHQESGERFYVMPSTDGNLIVTDRKNFRVLRRKHYVHPGATVRDLVSECFYCTPYRDGKGQLPEDVARIKRRQFFAWSKAVRKYRRTIKQQKKKDRQ